MKPEEGAWKGLSSLSEAGQEKVTALWRDHIQHTPKVRIPGKLKELKGDYKGYYQYDINQKDRMIYWVDDAEMIVYVEYIGAHPDWKRRRSRAY